MSFVVVSGLPGTGKTTVARPLARCLGLPLLSKDVVKETVADVLGTGDEDWSRRVGAAAFAVLFALARDVDAAVLETHWTEVARPGLRALHAPMVEIHCSCPPDVLRSRLEDRLSERHPIHRDVIRPDAIDEFVADPAGAPVGVGPLLELDTTDTVDLDAVAAWVRQHLAL